MTRPRRWVVLAAGLVACSTAPGSSPADRDAGAADAESGSEPAEGSDGSDGPGVVCAPASRCVGDGSVQSCGSDGQWGSEWPCATQVCASSACAGSTTAGPSCDVSAAGTTNCGPNGESCCASLEVPGGSYYRTYTNDGSVATGEADPAWVSGFRLDKYLVTVGRFRQFVAATVAGWVPPEGSGKHAHLNGGLGLASSSGAGYEPGWDASDTSQLATTEADWSARLNCEPSFQAWTDAPGAHETLPMNCIDWYEAYAFCIWDGGFLPTETEWEYAAAGGGEQRQYPWGSAEPGTASLYAISNCNYPPGSDGCVGVENLAPVGTATAGAGRWGQLDLAGGLSEWTLDWLAPYADPCTDCVILTDYSYRVVRGGSFGTDTQNLFPPARDGDVPPSRNSFYGARCARTP